MKVVLKKRVPKLGEEWDVITVKDGYAQNYLFPLKLATPATPALLKTSEKVRAERMKKLEEVIKNAKELAEKLKGVVLTFKKKTKGEKLYGSITEKDLIESLKNQEKIEVSREMIKMKEHIKTLGDHKVTLHLAEGVETGIKVVIEKEEEK
jgi:large subunit ribosomal protein L9